VDIPPPVFDAVTTLQERRTWSNGKDLTMDQLTIGHPRWREFLGRLEQRLEFRERSDKPGDYEWLCGKDGDPFAYAREVLTAMGLQSKASLANIRVQRHVCCDCEIVFNFGEASD
jgi:hypothetical protein